MNLNSSDHDGLKRQLIRTRRKMFRDFSKFRRYYFSHFHAVPDAAFHTELCAALGTMTAKRNMKLALAAPRGSAKSTIITLEYLIYSICYHTEECILIISNTADHSSEALLNIFSLGTILATPQAPPNFYPKYGGTHLEMMTAF